MQGSQLALISNNNSGLNAVFLWWSILSATSENLFSTNPTGEQTYHLPSLYDEVQDQGYTSVPKSEEIESGQMALKIEMDIFWCISITNNVKSCNKN